MRYRISIMGIFAVGTGTGWAGATREHWGPPVLQTVGNLWQWIGANSAPLTVLLAILTVIFGPLITEWLKDWYQRRRDRRGRTPKAAK